VVSRRSKVLSILVLSEDSSSEAYDTVCALAKEMLKLLVPGVQTDRVGFKPREDENARQALKGSYWKSQNSLDQPALRLLIRTIATELLKPDGFVLYHIDGDQIWSERASSENEREFRKRILQPVQAALHQALSKQPRPETTAEKRIKRLRLLMPFYSIEAWLYQNTREALRLCMEEGCKLCQPKLAKWEQSRASLDEEWQPKKALCLRGKYNSHLASGFPASAVYEAGASFTHAMMDLLDCDELTAKLELTYAPEHQ
jgi:hypothetical protein